MPLIPLVSDKDHIQGNLHAVIELVEYGDYQCPYCGRAHSIIKTIQDRFGNDLKFVFRNFPLSNVHPEAKIAAIAAEAAAQQGKFWVMHDILFENQKKLYASYLMKYADLIGLDTRQFEADLFDHALAEKVEDDFESGLRSGINHLPGFFINGEKYDGDWEQNLAAEIKSTRDYLLGVHKGIKTD